MAGQPHILGHYRIERTLGKGAMGVVYEGVDLRLHRRVAIKTVLKSEHAEAIADYTARFLREAQAVARLNHPNIVQVYDFGEEDDVSYIVMEFINGQDLKSHFESSERFELKEVVRIMVELLEALDFAHGNGVIHRDIKPANVMLDSQGRVKLTDFGVARLTDLERTRAERTQAGTMVGTPAYMSPEQVLGQHIDHRTDIFSAGVLLYQLLTGQKPFEGGAFTVARKIVENDPPPPSSVERSISPDFDRIVGRALAKSPDQRYSRAREFAEALQRVLDRKPPVELDEGNTILASAPLARDSTARRAEPAGRARTRELQATSAEADLEFWRSIKDSSDPDDLEFYIEKFPNGIYVDLARRKLAKLKRGPASFGDDDSGTHTRKIEEEFWRAIKDSNDPEDISLYIEKFPQGLYVDLARRKVSRLRKGPGPAPEEDSGSRSRQDELWRSISESTDPDDFQFYIEKFPQGIYAELAKRKIAKLGGAGTQAGWRIPEADNTAVLARLRAEAEAERREEERARFEAEEKARHEAQEKARLEAEEKARREAQEKARLEAEENARREAEAKAKREAEERARREAEEKARREAEERARREAEAKAKREAEERARREAEEKARREAEEKARREAEAKAKREAEERARREAEEKARREAEEKARREAEAKAKREAEDRARREAQEQARREAQDKARLEAEEKARREAEAKARLEAEEKARIEAQSKAKREAEERARREAEAALLAAERARQDAAERARREAQENARREAEEKARREAEDKARREADEARLAAERARKDAEERSRREAEAKARREAEENARREAEEKAKREAQERARREAEERAKRDAQEQARREAEAKAKREADEAAKRRAEEKARQQAAVAITMPAAAELEPQPASASRAPLFIGVGIVAMLVLAGGIAYYMLGTHETPAATGAPSSNPSPAVATPQEAPKTDGSRQPSGKAGLATQATVPEKAASPSQSPGTGGLGAPKAVETAKPPEAERARRAAQENAQREARSRRQAEEQQKAEAAKRDSEERQRRELADKARRDADERARAAAAKREAEQKAALDAERRAQQLKLDEERRKLKEEEQRIRQMRERDEQLQRQREAEKQKADAQKAEAQEQEKEKPKVFVPPTF